MWSKGLSKILYPLLHTGSTQEWSWCSWKIVDWDIKSSVHSFRFGSFTLLIILFTWELYEPPLQHYHGWKFKISKILNFRNSNFKTCRMPTKMNDFKFKWLCLENLKPNKRRYYNLPNSAFWGWLSTESQPQNPEFRINPENFHQCIIQMYSIIRCTV